MENPICCAIFAWLLVMIMLCNFFGCMGWMVAERLTPAQ
jgi:hypothetical protein